MKKRWVIVGIVLLLAGIGSIIYFVQNAEKEFTYSEVKATRGTLTLNVNAPGTVSPQNRLEIKPPVAGRIEEVLVKEGEIVKRGKILAWISSTERAALLDAARSKGKEEFSRWEEMYKPTPVMAPIDGTIILRNVEAGQSFTNVDSIFTMADRLVVKALVDETDIAQIRKNQKAIITLDAYPNNPVSGEVTQIAYDATVTNNVTTYEVDVLPEKVPDFMRSGMTGNVSVEVDRKEDVILLPLIAITTTTEGNYVEVKNNERPVLTSVEVGLDDGKLAEIISGLMENEIVLIREKIIKGKKKAKSPFMPMGGRGGKR